jgi:23S rRNA-/tRNA-specific pseudouridylate synthase
MKSKQEREQEDSMEPERESTVHTPTLNCDKPNTTKKKDEDKYLIRYLSEGNVNTVECPNWSGSLEPFDISNLVLYEDDHLIALYKPPTVLVQRDVNGGDNLVDAVKFYLQSKNKGGDDVDIFVGLVHRLDRPCSGVVVFAKSKIVASKLSFSFSQRKMEKIYMCVVNGIVLENGVCDDILLAKSNDKADRTRIICGVNAMNVTHKRNSVRALLEYSPLFNIDKGNGKHQTLLKVKLHTGRKHQVDAAFII